jgi:hypothetical protein
MVDSGHVSVLEQGVEAWNLWRKKHPAVRPDLSRADLMHCDLKGANLAEVNLFRSSMVSTDLRDSMLVGANLGWADLANSNLQRSDLTGAFLTGADLHRAALGRTRIGNVDLSAVKNLHTIVHHGPSTIGTDCLELTASGLSRRRGTAYPAGQPGVRASVARDADVLAFLKGCGVPEELIKVFVEWTSAEPEYYSCFISYSHEDGQFADRLYRSLQEKGIPCWLDEDRLLPGDDISDEVYRGIWGQDKILICCSESSLSSPWIDRELDAALQKEEHEWRQTQEKSRIIIPLNLDGYLFEWQGGLKASQLKSRLAADFTGWLNDEDKFKSQVDSVIRALRRRS